MATKPAVPQEEVRRPDVLPTAPPSEPVRPPTPVVTASHVLATASGGLDFEKKSVYFDLSVAGQDDITSLLLKALLDSPVSATVTPKHDVTGLKLHVEFSEPAAFDEVAPMIEDARRLRGGLPTLAQEAEKAAAQAAAVAAGEKAAAAAIAAQDESEDRIAKKAAAMVMEQLKPVDPPKP